MKAVLSVLVFLVALAVARALMQRLTETTRQLAELRDKMASNDRRLTLEMERLEATVQAKETEAPDAGNKREL